MRSKRVEWASVLVLVMVVSAFSVGASGGRDLAQAKAAGKAHKEHPAAASEKGATATGDMVKTNDYGRYDPTPAFSKPRFKLIPN